MSDTTTKYPSWQQAALGGNLLSYAAENLPSALDSLAGPPNPNLPSWLGEAARYASIPAKVATNALIGPFVQGGNALQSWMQGDQGPDVQHQITGAMTGLLGRGLASNPLGAGTEGTLGSFTGWHGTPHDFHQFSDEAIGSG